MPHLAPMSKHGADHAIIERLFRASLEVHSALSIAAEQRTVCLLRQTIDHLDRSIKQVQSRALDLELRPPRGPTPYPSPARPRAAEPEGSVPAAAR
jgi:hypothetical protein